MWKPGKLENLPLWIGLRRVENGQEVSRPFVLLSERDQCEYWSYTLETEALLILRLNEGGGAFILGTNPVAGMYKETLGPFTNDHFRSEVLQEMMRYTSVMRELQVKKTAYCRRADYLAHHLGVEIPILEKQLYGKTRGQIKLEEETRRRVMSRVKTKTPR